MNAFQQLLHCDGSTPRARFIRNALLLIVGKSAVDLQVLHLRPDLAENWSWTLSWFNPFHLVMPWVRGDVASLICFTTFLFHSALVWNSVHRARDAGWNHWLGLLTAIPFVNVAMVTLLGIVPQRKHTVWDLI